jgi:threonyl-tRNA synthetase
MHLDHDYQPVYTPHIGRSNLWETSGHLGFYRESMFTPMQTDDDHEFFAKPMNCPFHVLIYRSKTRSYRELPLRLSELGTVYRYERSGVVHGLLRSRGFTQDDSHIFCRPDQVVDELVGVIDFFRELYGTVGLGPDRVRFSTKPEKYVGSDELWELAESAIPEALDRAKIEYAIDAGDGAFYGPKIDIDVRDAIGRYWQLATIQVDFNLPERFGLEYTDEHGARVQPVMIHRALFGAVERFIGVLVEHYAGAFPSWLAPVQAVVVPIADRHADYADTVGADLRSRALRVEVDNSRETMQSKVRTAEMQKVPYILVVGDKEVEAKTVAVRARGTAKARFGVPTSEFAENLEAEVAARELVSRYASAP